MQSIGFFSVTLRPMLLTLLWCRSVFSQALFRDSISFWCPRAGFCCFVYRTGVVPEVFSWDFVFALMIWPPDYMMYKFLVLISSH